MCKKIEFSSNRFLLTMTSKVNDASTRAFGRLVELVDSGSHPVGLACDVRVVSAKLGTQTHQCSAVESKRTGGGHNHFRGSHLRYKKNTKHG